MTRHGSVSVALATYNGERFLHEQLRSLANQSVLPAELVVCDDQSQDGTPRIVAQFARTAPFPVSFHRNDERLHFGENFIRAALRCKGRYVSFCDQDDIWLPQKIEKSLEALERSSALLCAHATLLIDEGGRQIDVPSSSRVDSVLNGNDLDPWDVFAGFTCTFDRHLLEMIPASQRPIDLIFPDRKSAHDRWVYFLASSFGHVVYIGEPLALYRQHGRNTYGYRTHMLTEKLRKVRQKYREYLEIRLAISSQNAALLRDFHGSARTERPLNAERRRWSALEAEYRNRSEIFGASSIPGRIIRLARCAASDIYTDLPGKKAYRSVLEDLLGALIAH